MKSRLVIPLLVLIIAALACNVPAAVSPDAGTGTPEAVRQMLTQVAQTVEAELAGTPGAAGTPNPEGTQPAGVSTPFPTLALIPTSTQSGGSAESGGEATPAACDAAGFVTDVPVPAGALMAPGQAFTKTWRLRNSGSCPWTTGYALVFVDGDAMNAPAAVGLSAEVAPGTTVDLSIDMQAPAQPGEYTGFWRLRNADGMQFGTGENQPFFVQIEVSTEQAAVTPSPGGATAAPTALTSAPGSGQAADILLANTYCDAEWRTQSGTLRCPGTLGSSIGYVVLSTNPQLEGTPQDDGPVLLTVPNKVSDGAITGKFPAITVERGMRFRAELGCLKGVFSCEVVYQLNYIVGNSQPASLGQWAHTYRGTLQSIDVDLSPLAGQEVQLILAVLSNGPSAGDLAVWVNPRIQKQQ